MPGFSCDAGQYPHFVGGPVQALPNFQTTLRHHPHPASRPMTFGHFTSWHADDRGYYSGPRGRRRRRARAKKKRMCPAWYYLTGMMALAGAQPLLQKFEKVARKSPFDRNVEKVLGFLRIRKSARDEILTKKVGKPLFFNVFMLKSLRKRRFWKDFVLRARMCTLCYFLQWILEVWLC